MRLLILAFLLFCASAFAQVPSQEASPLISVQLTIQFPLPVLYDITTSYLQETTGTCGTLTASMAATDLAFTVSVPTASFILPTSTAVVIDGALPIAEAFSVAGFSAGANPSITIITVAAPRGPSALFPMNTASAHAIGATCAILTNASPAAMITREALEPWTVSKVNQLALQGKSATLYSAVTGMTVLSQ